MNCTVSVIRSDMLNGRPNHRVEWKEYKIIPMNAALTGSIMSRSMNSMRRSRRGGSGAGISNKTGNRLSH